MEMEPLSCEPTTLSQVRVGKCMATEVSRTSTKQPGTSIHSSHSFKGKLEMVFITCRWSSRLAAEKDNLMCMYVCM